MTRQIGRRNILGFGAAIGAAFAANRLLVACDGDDTFAGEGSDASTDGATATGATADTCELTAGPCYDSASEVIQDISRGRRAAPAATAAA